VLFTGPVTVVHSVEIDICIYTVRLFNGHFRSLLLKMLKDFSGIYAYVPF